MKNELENFESPSEDVKNQMIQNGFTVGVPKEAGWYLAAVRTNDEQERYFVLQLWYNPMAIHKWWTGGGYVSRTSHEYSLANQIRAYSKLPEFIPKVDTKINSYEYLQK